MIIAKTYSSIIADGLEVFASDIHRAFDDIYCAVNGNVDNANLDRRLTLQSSRVAINDTAGLFSGTVLDQVINEIKERGYNDVHMIAMGSEGLSFFPGRIEVCGVFCRVNSRLNVTAVNSVFGTPYSSFTSDTRYWVTLGNCAITLTASDFALETVSDVDFTLNRNAHYTIGSGRRIIATVYNDGSAQSLYDFDYEAKPRNAHIYQLTNDEASRAGFTSYNTAATTGAVSVVTRIYDKNDGRYMFKIQGTTLDGSGTLSVFNGQFATTSTGGVWTTREIYVSACNVNYGFNGIVSSMSGANFLGESYWITGAALQAFKIVAQDTNFRGKQFVAIIKRSVLSKRVTAG